MTTFHASLSHACYNKTLLTGDKRDHARGFKSALFTIDQLAQHVTSGKRFSAVFKNNYRTRDNFISSQIIGLDFDNDVSTSDLKQHPFAAQYAALCYATSSSTPEKPRSRLIFVLSEPIEGLHAAARYEALMAGLARDFGVVLDENTLHASIGFYGSDTRDFWITENTLPIDIAGALTADIARDDYAEYRRKLDAPRAVYQGGDSDYVRAYVNAAIDNEYNALATAPDGMRTAALKKSTIALYGLVLGGYVDESTVIRALEDAGDRSGLNAKKVRRTIKSCARYAKARDIPAPTPKAKARRNKNERGFVIDPPSAPAVILPTFTADEMVNVRYISELDAARLIEHRALLIKSPTNTGKTAFIGRYYAALKAKLGREPKVLVVTHRQALSENLSQRLTDETGAGFENYGNLKVKEMRQPNALIICYNSLWKLAPQTGQELPHYDLIVIDELQQFHSHLDGRTMRGGTALRAYTYLRQLATSAAHFIGLDAHLSDVCRQWAMGVAGAVYCIENTHQFDRGALVLHKDDTTVIAAAQKTALDATAPIAIACTSKAKAKVIYELFAQTYGTDRVRLLDGDNSEDRDTFTFIAQINVQLPTLKVLIYTTSLGTGVDITAPVSGAFGLFSRVDGLSAYDQHQLLARCRNAAIRHVFVEDCEGRRDTDANRIYKRHERNAFRTANFCDFDNDGVVILSPLLQSAGKLLAMLTAEKNAAQNSPLAYFMTLATGYKITAYQGEQNSAVKAEMKAARELVADRAKTAVFAAPVVSHEDLQRARDKNALTPEHRAGNEKFKILDTVGRDELTDQLYTDLHTSEKRAILRRFTNLDETPETLKAQDAFEHQTGVLISRRSHHAINQHLALSAFKAVWGDQWRDGVHQELTGAEIEARLSPFLESNARHDLYSFMGRHYGKSQRAIPLLRWMLIQHGLILNSRQVMRDNARIMVYWLDRAALAKMDDYARTRRAHLEQKRLEAYEAGLLKTVNKDSYSNPEYDNTAQLDPFDQDEQWRLTRTANLAVLGDV